MTMTAKERAGIEADQVRRDHINRAIQIQDLNRKIAALDAKRKAAGQAPDGGAECQQILQQQVYAAAERFVQGLWSDAHSVRPVTLDLSNPDAVAFFLCDTITAKLPELADRVMSSDMRGSQINAEAVAMTIAALNADESALRQQLADLVARYPEAAKRAGVEA